jgi:hypothetical protein
MRHLTPVAHHCTSTSTSTTTPLALTIITTTTLHRPPQAHFQLRTDTCVLACSHSPPQLQPGTRAYALARIVVGEHTTDTTGHSHNHRIPPQPTTTSTPTSDDLFVRPGEKHKRVERSDAEYANQSARFSTSDPVMKVCDTEDLALPPPALPPSLPTPTVITAALRHLPCPSPEHCHTPPQWHCP